MAKIKGIDLGSDRLLSIAADCIEAKDYLTALKMLNKNAVTNGDDADSYLLYAEVFDDMYLCDKSVNYWFKHLDYAGDGADFAEAYEGLAINFMRMGEDAFASHYFERLLEATEPSMSREERGRLVDQMLFSKKQGLHFAYPPHLSDFTTELGIGKKLINIGNYKAAISVFQAIPEGNSDYILARNLIAMTYVLDDDEEAAEAECRAILEKSPNDVQAIATLTAILKHKNSEEVEQLVQRIDRSKLDNDDDIFRLASIYCQLGLHKDAYDILDLMGEGACYDSVVLFFRAIAAYNCGMIDTSLEIFDTLLTIYPCASTAEYWRAQVAKEAKKPEEKRKKELKYAYHLPERERQKRAGFLTEYDAMDEKMAKIFAQDERLPAYIHWCFDEGGSPTINKSLKLCAVRCVIKAGLEDLIRDILLDSTVSDYLKIYFLSALVQRNTGGDYGLVMCNLYARIELLPLDIGEEKKSMFLNAYGKVVSQLSILNRVYARRVADATRQLYADLQSRGNLSVCHSANALSAAIALRSKIKLGSSDVNVCYLMATSQKTVNKILVAAGSEPLAAKDFNIGSGEKDDSEEGEEGND